MAEVSVLIATYNRPEMLRKTVQSVLDQTFQDFEIVVVDDGQKVSAEEVVTSFADERISYIKHSEQRGCAGSRVTGIQASKGDFVAFLDDDDVWEPYKLEVQLGRLKDTPADVGFSFTSVTQVFDDRTQVTEVPDGVGDYYERALSNFSGFLSVTLMFKRSVFEQVGLPDPLFPSHTDIEFILRVTYKLKGLGINQPLTRVNSKTDHAHMGTDYSNRIRGREMLLAKHRAEFEKRPRIYAKHLFKLAWFYRSNRRYQEARAVYRRVLSVRFTWRYLVFYLGMLGNGFGYRLFRFLKGKSVPS